MFWTGLYNGLLLAAALVALPWYGARMLLTGKYRRSLGAKFGRLSPETAARLQAPGSPRIWVHAVSVGEVTAAAPIVAALRERFPGAWIGLSTATETGQAMARDLIAEASAHFYYPLDLPAVVRRLLDLAAPDLFVPVETELWPNFLRLCRARGTGVLLVNGRISPRSFRRYGATRFFWGRVLGGLDGAGVISPVDGERLAALGMPPARIRCLGNAKYDGLAARVSPALAAEAAARTGIAPGEPVLVAGSTHEGEEAVVLDVYRRLLAERPGFKLILIPRHVERAEAVAALAAQAGFPDLIRMSEILAGRARREERLLLVDVIGELFKLYSLATVVYCGGSLVPRGGQNLLEAAAWGKVVFHGPHMEDFREERALLEAAGGSVTVGGAGELYRGIAALLADPEGLGRRGEAARAAVAANRGAAARYADLIATALEK